MRVLVTRPIEDAQETALLLERRGHAALIAPLLDIHFIGGALSLDDVLGILVTSSNGVRALARRTARRDLPLFVVGRKTQSVARRLGFADVTAGPGDAASLASSLSGWIRPEQGVLLYAAGELDSGALEVGLAATGYRVRREVLYAALPATRLPANAREALANGRLDAVLLFSPRSAAIFVKLVTEEAMVAHLKALHVCCISDATAAAFGAPEVASLRVASSPDQENLLRLLD